MRRLRHLALTALAGAGAVIGLVISGTGVASAATAPTVSTGGGPLKVRSTASTTGAVLGTLANGAKLTIVCQQSGEKIKGYARTTTAWDKLADGRYVSDAYVRRTGTAPVACPAPKPPAPVTVAGTGTWVRPVDAKVGDGFRPPSRPTHDGVDLPMARNTPILAAAAGTVVTAECNASPTHNCDVDGSFAIAGCGWYVEVRHADSSVTRYCHMIRRPSVNVGQPVTAGQVLGYVGTSGNSSGPHLHFEVHTGYPATRLNAIDPAAFMAVKGVPFR